MEREKTSDRISNLSESILISILSRLPIKQAARTSVLSKTWRYLWNSRPDLVFTSTLDRSEEENKAHGGVDIAKWLSIVYNILYSRRDPVNSCWFTVDFFDPSTPHFHNFIYLLSKVGVKELLLFNSGPYYQLSSHAFFCQSLEELQLSCCEVVLPPSFQGLCRLKILVLDSVEIAEDHFERLISCCPTLEYLAVAECVSMKNLRIRAPNLLALNIVAFDPIRISLENALHLNRAKLWFFLDDLEYEEIYTGRPNDEDEASKIVELLMNLGGITDLTLDCCLRFAKCLLRESLPESFSIERQLHKLEKLSMSLDLVDANMAFLLVFLLRSCPNLQQFFISVKRYEEMGEWVELECWDRWGTSVCLMHLKTVRIHLACVSSHHEIGFLKFLLMNAHVLKRMIIGYSKRRGELSKYLMDELLLFQRASPDAVLQVVAI